ncbi:MAG: pilus assembly protein TadG-related protein [Kiritimatiellia bacterium]
MKVPSAKSGQIVLVLLFMLLGLVFLLVMETDIFSAIRGKTRIQNAGDAAALAGARWQGITLNLIGELNLIHVAASCESNETAAAGIVALQERLAVAGPVVGLMAANAAALENKAPIHDDFTQIVAARAQAAAGYASDTWPDKGADYGNMLRIAAAGGLATGNDNASLLPICSEYHPLYDLTFYEAVRASDWRRICLNCFAGDHSRATATLLSWNGWPAPPPLAEGADLANSEFLSLHLRRATVALEDASRPAAAAVILAAAGDLGLGDVVTQENLDAYQVLSRPRTWYFYDDSAWRTWRELDIGGTTRFPLENAVRPEYDVMGATSLFKVRDELVPLAQIARTNTFEWTAAAKPFGSVDHAGGTRRVIDLFSVHDGSFNAPLVLPSFRFVRLIPIGGVGTPDPEDASGSSWSSSRGASDPAWLEHVNRHVPHNQRVDACRYCGILLLYGERADHLRAGGRYLMEHAHDDYCAPPSPPGGKRGGGTSHAH